MKRKRLLTLIGSLCLVVALVAIPFTACTPEPTPTPTSTPTPAPAAEKTYPPFIYTVAYPNVNRCSWLQCEGALKLITERSNGRITFDYHPGSELITAKDQLAAMESGVIDGCFTAMMYHEDVAPEGGISFAPCTFDSFGDAVAFHMLPEVRSIIRDSYMKSGAYYLGSSCNFEQSIHMNVKIEKIEDFQGLKIRAGGGVMDEIVTALGANMFFCVGGEIYTAMQTGTVDGFIYPSYCLVDLKYGEVTKYTIVRPWITPCATMSHFFSLKAWNSLTPNDQRLVQKAVDDHMLWYTIYTHAAMEENLERVVEEFGVELIYLPEKEVEKFEKLMTETVWERYAASSPGSARILEILKWYKGEKGPYGTPADIPLPHPIEME